MDNTPKPDLKWLLENINNILPHTLGLAVYNHLPNLDKKAFFEVLNELRRLEPDLPSKLLERAVLLKNKNVILKLLEHNVILKNEYVLENVFHKKDDKEYYVFLENCGFDMIKHRTHILMHTIFNDKPKMSEYLISQLETDNEVVLLLFNSFCNSYKKDGIHKEQIDLIVSRVSTTKIAEISSGSMALENYLQYYLLGKKIAIKNIDKNCKMKL